MTYEWRNCCDDVRLEVFVGAHRDEDKKCGSCGAIWMQLFGKHSIAHPYTLLCETGYAKPGVGDSKWNVKYGRAGKDIYARRQIGGGRSVSWTCYQLHTFVLLGIAGQGHALTANHIGGTFTLDNRLMNLEAADTSKSNLDQNKRVNCSSQYLRVCWYAPSRTWQGAVPAPNRPKTPRGHMARVYRFFKNELEAAEWGDNYIRENIPDYIERRYRMNFPRPGELGRRGAAELPSREAKAAE